METTMPETKRILLVDDDRDILRGTSLRLRAAGYETIVAEDGAEGLVNAVKHIPDAIVLDVRMPHMDGLTALSKLRQSGATRHIPIIMLSASLVDQGPALDAGARFFLTKPYQGQSLLDAVAAVVSEPLPFAT